MTETTQARLDTSRKTSFGATAPPFIDYLKDILRRYPDGGQILKELIQNAEDAQATEVVFIHDERSYGTESLCTNELGKYQGPALYVYNNAAFTDDDWEGIQMAGRSVKRNDPNKVGRFGIGFNSVYHTTDLPSIFSSGHLGLMDPQEKIFGERNGGFLWSLDDAEHQDTLMNMYDQFQPFRDIVSLVSQKEWSKVIMEDQHFDGTIFRFPLRNEPSDISDNLYDSDKVVELFDSFIADADLSLLFLKNVTSVSLKHIDIHGTVNTRLEVKASVPTDVILESNIGPVVEGCTRFKSITLNSGDPKETKWLVTTCTMKEGNVKNLDSLAQKLSFLPQVDLAFPCVEKRDPSESRLSCFLPLPNNESNKTGLPIYLNACFGLTDNRRHIKWQEDDQKHDEYAVWNELLMKEVLPQAYLMIIQDAIKLARKSVFSVSSVYDLWPDIAQIQHKEKWYAVAVDVLLQIFRQNVAILSLAKNERMFITPSEAVFPCNGPTSPEVLAAITRTLVFCDENLVTLPGSCARAINEVYPHLNTLKHVTPTFLRESLHRIDIHKISKDDKLCLLEYILSDGKYRELEGLQLLPLNDGSFRFFTDREEDTALIDSEEVPRVLLPFCKHLFIPDDLSAACKSHLKEMARKHFFNVINIDANQVAEYARRYLPQDWKQTGRNKQISLPDQITQLMDKVGGTVVRGNEWLKHKDLDSYVLCPSPRGVMTVLVNLDSQYLIKELKTTPREAREDLKELPMPDSVVQCATEVDRSLLQLLKVRVLDTAEAAILLIDCIEEGACSKQDTEKIMTWILQHAEIRDSVYKHIVEYVMPLMGNLSDRVSSKLGLKDQPPPEKVRENLEIMASKAKKMADPDTNVDFKSRLHSIYRYMQEHIYEFAAMKDMDTNWLWSHNQFVSPRDLVLDYPRNLDLSSYIKKVPNEFLPYKTLLQEFGLRSLLSDDEVVGILYSIQQNIERRQQPFASSAEVKVSIEILNWLWRERIRVQDDIPVPVLVEGEKYTLKQRSTAVFCDVSKSGLKDSNYNQEIIHVMNEEIPRATAEWLNITFFSTYILNPELVGIEQWGQSEPITTRIKNILKEYDEESDIFKELIQNAEDATAKVCKFLVDYRVHKDAPDSLIDPDMTLCQGPCLWAFNNEQFTAEDWTNIVRVGSASKENKVEKIGKFGLGFNTVYHVTDVPSILSGNSLLILDPNITHLSKHIKHKTNPGIKLDLSKQQLFDWFPGQFGPYEHIFDCNFTRQNPPQPYQGTLIKLPFRTEDEALKSEISTKVYHKHNILHIQQHLTKNSQTHLLFLKNINTLSLQSISNDASTPPREDEIETILTISKTTMSTIGIPDEAAVSKQHEAAKSLMNLDGKCKEVIDCCTINTVQITSQQSGVTEVQSWLLYNCFGTHQSLNMALEEIKQAKFSLPIGGVAVPLQFNSETGKLSSLQSDLVGEAFCFLPLSIHTGLPVNVNGTFALTNNRKGLWESGVKHEWNTALLQDPVVTAYITVLLALKKMSENKQLDIYCYHNFWPNREKVSETFRPLVDAFYTIIAQDSIGPELFSDGEHWCSINSAIFLHESIEEDKDISALAVQVCKKYAKPPNRVIPLPLWLRNSLKQAGLDMVLQKRTWNWKTFYQESVFTNLCAMDPMTRDTLVLHAIDLHIKEIDDLLVCYPCIPTKGGQLQYISKLVYPKGKAACLFNAEEVRLLGGTEKDFCSPKRIQRLLELGMASDDLPLEDLTEKAEAIMTTWSTDKKKAYEQLKCLLELMKNHMNDKHSLLWKKIRMTEFLPAFSPGDTKMERNATLRKPIDVFSGKCSLLVNLTQPVLDHNGLKIHNTDPVLHILGVHDSPSLETVLDQLQEACKKSHSTDSSMLQTIAHECYRFLDQWLREGGESRLISQRANSFPFILIGNKFVNVKNVAENEQFEAKPYLYVLPSSFTDFRKLWESVGVAKSFTIDQFLCVLQELHSKHGNKPLPTSDLLMCLTILQVGIFQADKKTIDNCLIPNELGVLQPANELFYNDSPWMPQAPGITLCHKNISRAMARHFEIKTTRHHTLQNHIVEDLSPFAFHFEQKEKLTVRIKNIISAYPSKKDILKELLQNADDAEATEIHFVWDKRQHGKEKTFGKRWNHLQGPALCVFNNKVFSDADLVGIQQLGVGGKHDSTGKTGKYGVGFNSVYHLTDCPSILTGDELLCISDPNEKYIENHSGKSPGIGYKLDSTFKSMYIDVYRSFLPDQFSLKQGTMFRLPLRKGTMANSSEISKQGVTDSDMNELCSALSEDPEGLILFLKHISKIKVYEINENLEKLENIFTVEKSIPQTCREEKDAFVKAQQKALKSDKPVSPCKAIYKTIISALGKGKSEWIIAEQFGSFKKCNGIEVALSDKLPQAAIAALVNSDSPRMNFNGAEFCSLPLPVKTGLPVHVNANFEVDSARRGLWKEDGQSLKTKWNESLKHEVIAPLYADVLHFISKSIAEKKGSSLSTESLLGSSYLCFWPHVSKDANPDWHEMIHEVYRSIKENGLNVIPVKRTSTRKIAGRNIKEYSFVWCNTRETEATQALYLTHSQHDPINPILEGLGMKLVPFSTEMEKVWSSFKSAGVESKDVNPSTVRKFLTEKPLNDPTQTVKGLPLPITATLIKDETTCSKLLSFCLKDFQSKKVTKDNSSSLNGLPLLLTKDKVLRVFDSNSPNLISRYENLFLGCEDQFAHYQINNMHIDVLKQCNLVQNLRLPWAAKTLKPLIQQHLLTCEVDPDSGLHVPNKKTMKWLNVLWKFLASEIESATSRGDEESLTLNDLKMLFCDCCILPVVCPRLRNKHLLQTIKYMPSVIPFASEQDISGILFKLGFMKLNNVFFREVQVDPLKHLFLYPELMNVNDKNSVLDQVYNVKHSEISKLSSKDMNELQNFLQSGASKAKDIQEYHRKLKSLPIFETVQGERVRIDGAKSVYILKSIHLEKYSDLFTMPNSSTIFLKDSPENCSLSETLPVQVLNDLIYFMKFILPAVHTLTESQTLSCLKLLLSLQIYQDYPKYRGQIISSLKTVNLIRNSQGSLKTASYYFDESVELYQKMLPQERFVPKEFWNEFRDINLFIRNPVRELLKELGMNHVVSADDIIKFAHQIESDAKTNCQLEILKQKSTLVFKAALKIVNNIEENNLNLLESIADIEFIFPVTIQKELCNFHQPFVTDRTAVKIRGSLMEIDHKCQELIWSSMPIIDLPVYRSQKILQMMKNVGAHEQPPPKFVTSNLSNICQSPCKTDELIKTRATVFRSCYTYLQANGFEVKTLVGLPVVLVEKDRQVVRSENVSLSLHYHLEFRPYLYQILPQDTLYVEFFKKIGITEKPTAKQYCNVLAEIHADSCEKPELNPNQLKTVKRAVEQLFQLITAEGNQSFDDVTTMYLLAVDGKLHPSCTLYYNDTVFETRRLEEALENKYLLLENLSECHLGIDIYEHHQVLRLLPLKFQPKMLSQFTEEKVVELHMQLCELEPNCVFSGWFNKHLSSVAFRHGLICLIREHSKGKITQKDASDMCEKTFGGIQIVCCQSLETELWLNKQQLPTSATETDVFVKRGQNGCIFYLKHSDTMEPKVINEVNMTLTKEINALLGNSIASFHLTVLGQLLMCDSLQDVQKALAKNGIHDSVETKSFRSNPPAPGTDIPEVWHDSLDMDIFNIFEEGEYVGYHTNNKYIYAIIVAELPGRSGQYSWRYKINIGKDEPIEVSCLDLYQIKREKKPKPEERTHTYPESSSMELELHSSQHNKTSSSQPSTSSSSRRSLPVSFAEAKREIDKCLAEIWTLPKEERDKAIKRLYLRWHPDKNPDSETLATEAFQYLQNRIDELSKGTAGKTAGSSCPRGKSHYKDFYQQWNQEARHHRSSREKFSRNFHSYNFWTYNENVPRPNKEEAQRWCRQARCDLQAAYNDIGGKSTEWCLFKVHQAVEKSLIAVEYKKSGQHPSSLSISDMAERATCHNPQFSVLPQIVKRLKMLGVDAKKTQYPNCYPCPQIPNGQFKPENEMEAVRRASELLCIVEAYVN
ncbi:hypothetical protein Q8A73_010118 [Channa argus]|nr:hypothetical protein Q8A73_010118 [Channa argus]